MKNDVKFLFTLARANTVLSRYLSGHGLDFGDYMILYHLNEAPEQKLRRVDLAEKLGLTASGITRMLLPLEKLGIITRDLSEDDARSRYATITNGGKNILQDANLTLEMRLEDMMPDGCEEDLVMATALLENILLKLGK